MSPLPVRADPKANLRPSGENSGRDSVAGCETIRGASPPAATTVQMSPPETKAISEPSGESAGSVKYGWDGRDAGCARAAIEKRASREDATSICTIWRNPGFESLISVEPSGVKLWKRTRGILQHFFVGASP